MDVSKKQPPSGQDFVRALKQSSEKTPFGIGKVELAQNAWNDPAFHLPSKAQVIAEWLLNRLTKAQNESIVLDYRAWDLLSALVRASESQPWFSSLVQKVSIPRLVTHVLKLSHENSQPLESQTMPAIMSCLPSLWSISAPRTSPEAQLETIGCFLELASRSAEFMKTFKALGLLLSSSFQSTLKFVTNKRKLHSLFVTKYIEHWITVLSYPSLAEELSRSLFSFGAELLFIPEVLRNDPTSGDHLFSSFSKFTESNTSQWMLVLAKLFESFLSALQAHKSNLPGPSKSEGHRERFNSTGKAFFYACHELLPRKHQDPLIFWEAKRTLLQTVKDHQLFRPAEAEKDHALVLTAADCVLALEQSLDGELWQAPLECLKLVSQLNFELVASSLPRILALLVSDQTRSHSADEFLKLSFDYHCKLKSLTLYTEAVIEGAFLCNLQKGSTLPSRIFLFHSLHLSRMHRGFSSYLSHGQIEPLLGILEASLHRCWFDDSSTIAVEPSPQNKRRRISTNQSKDPNTRAMHTYLVCEISCHVLSALPRVPEDAKDEVQRIIHGFRTNIVLRKIRQLVDDLSSQSSQTVVAGLIRLNYNLTIVLADDLNIVDEQLFTKLLEASQKFGLDDGPPFVLETYRMLLMWSSASPPNRLGPTLDSLLHYLDCHHTFDESSTSVLSMLLQRWMHVVDAHAHISHISQILRRSIRYCLSTSYDGYGQNVILASTLYSAAFWELPRTREALSTIMDKEIGEIESTLLTAEFPDIFSFLLYIPGEYLPKQTLASFFKVAMTREGNMTMDNAPRLFTTQATRAFMSRYLSTHEAADISEMDAIELLRNIFRNNSPAKVEGFDITLELVANITSWFLSRWRQAGLQQLLQLYVREGFKDENKLQFLSFARLGKLVCEVHFQPDGYADNLSALLRDIRAILYPHVKAMDSSDQFIVEVLHAWHAVLQLHVYQHTDLPSNLLIGKSLTRNLLRRGTLGIGSESSNILKPILYQEYLLLDSELQVDHLNLILALVLSGDETDSIISQLGVDFSKLTKGHFKLALSFVTNGLHDLDPDRLENALQLFSLLILKSPPGSSKCLQMSFTSLLDTIIDRPTFIYGPLSLRLRTLEVVYDYFKERPSWIRQTDLPSVWVLLVRILAPSTERDEATSTETFSKIIMILSTLVRLRRDILTSALPHFASVLRLLLQVLRQPRSQLGPKQSTMVMNQLPRWIACGQPLDLCAAQDLARLLEAITTKTVMRRQVPNEDAKAESLARPFSKHASTILKAYVDIVNDTLCVIPLDVRRALQPGLFALCGMTGYHNRDALMVSSLDTGGMAVLKSLWAEFEKQRYVGRG